MGDELLIKVEQVSKKYCYSLKKSMLYGVQDITRDLLGFQNDGDRLRPSEFWSLRNVSFSVRPGESLGIIGHNGSGKSTLLKIISGIIPPDTGRIRLRGRIATLIEVGAGFHPLLSGRENIYVNGGILGLCRREIDRKFDAIVSFAGLEEFIDTPVKHYSSGMFVRLGFSVASHVDPDIFLIDEALAVGDIAFRMKCLNRIAELRKNGSAIVFVSHSEMQVREAADRCLLLNHGTGTLFESLDTAFQSYQKVLFEENDGSNGFEHADFMGDIEIKRIEIEQNDKSDPLSGGQPLIMNMYLDVHTPVQDAYLVLRIWSPYGYLAVGIDSRDSGFIFDLCAGGHTLRIEISSLPLVPGKYRVGGGIRRETEIVAWSTRLAWLDISAKANQVIPEGIVAVSTNYSVDSK